MCTEDVIYLLCTCCVQNYGINEVMVRYWQDKKEIFVDNMQKSHICFYSSALISLKKLLYSCENLGSFVQNNFDKCS